MEQEKIVVGLDIGTTKICAIVGRKNEFGKLEVLGMGKAESEGVVKGIVFNIDKTVYAIEKAIRKPVIRLVLISGCKCRYCRTAHPEFHSAWWYNTVFERRRDHHR